MRRKVDCHRFADLGQGEQSLVENVHGQHGVAQQLMFALGWPSIALAANEVEIGKLPRAIVVVVQPPVLPDPALREVETVVMLGHPALWAY